MITTTCLNHTSGNLLTLADNGRFDVIIHGCNCFCVMGGGIAKKIADRWPAAAIVDKNTNPGDRNKLGTFTEVNVITKTGQLKIINAYTQFNTSSSKDVFEYDAFEKILDTLQNSFINSKNKIRCGFPKIGCGLAGGDEKRIINMIDNFTNKVKNHAEITLVHYA